MDRLQGRRFIPQGDQAFFHFTKFGFQGVPLLF